MMAGGCQSNDFKPYFSDNDKLPAENKIHELINIEN